MNKKKIKKSVSKRFKVTKTGKVVFRHQYQSHLKMSKSKRRIRRQKEPGKLTGTFAKKIKQMLGHA
ncbi:MAG: 50S ribosomal protein L35 [Candidatus Levybacteria bacterium CG_4_10_14_0_8_um_filter_35_23]|nr:MAG: 50S ribosomal protein L35 [Candidatus Levybacteria bacterium CG_4_10_14_0_8_um_filter_35_23]